MNSDQLLTYIGELKLEIEKMDFELVELYKELTN